MTARAKREATLADPGITYMPQRKSKTPFITGWCGNDDVGEPLHSHCRGTVRGPASKGPGFFYACSCQCHSGQDLAPPPDEVPLPRRKSQQRFKGDPSARADSALSDLLEKGGYATLEIPEGADPKEVNRLNSRLHNAAKRRGLKVTVRKCDGATKLVAQVKGDKR